MDLYSKVKNDTNSQILASKISGSAAFLYFILCEASPWHGPVQFVQAGGQAVLQDVVDDQLRVVVVLLQAGQQEAFAQIRQQLLDTRQQRLQLRLAHRTHRTLTTNTKKYTVSVGLDRLCIYFFYPSFVAS